MEYRNLGRTGLKVSELCLGTMTFGWTADEGAAFRIMDMAVEAGVNFFDTADVYGTHAGNKGVTEEIIGKWLDRTGRRHQIVLATKVRASMSEDPNDQGLSRRHIIQAVEASLRRLHTDYIDLYQSHWFDDDTPMGETFRAFDDLVRQGKVRYVGCSNHPAWKLCKALWTSDVNGFVRYESLQPHYNLVHRSEFEEELMPLCGDQGLGVIPYRPLAGGFLTGKYRKGEPPPEGSRGAERGYLQQYMTDENFALIDKLEEFGKERGKTIGQMALAWLLTNPLVTAPIVGARTPEQLAESLGAAGLRLSEEEVGVLNEMSEGG